MIGSNLKASVSFLPFLIAASRTRASASSSRLSIRLVCLKGFFGGNNVLLNYQTQR